MNGVVIETLAIRLIAASHGCATDAAANWWRVAPVWEQDAWERVAREAERWGREEYGC